MKNKSNTFLWLKNIKKTDVYFGIFVVFGGVLILNFLSLQGKIETLNRNQEVFRDEVGEKIQILEENSFSENDSLEIFSQEMNEIRKYLLLPEKEYSFIENKPTTEVVQKDIAQSTLTYFDYLGNQEENRIASEKANSLFASLIASEVFEKMSADFDLVFRIEKNTSQPVLIVEDEKNRRMVSFEIYYPTYTFVINQEYKTREITFETDEDIKTDIVNYLTSNREYLQKYVIERDKRMTELQNIVTNPDVQEILTNKGLKIDPKFEENDEYFIVAIQNTRGDVIDNIFLDKTHLKFEISDIQANIFASSDNKQEFTNELLEYLEEIDPVSEKEKIVVEKKDEFLEMIAQPAFQDTLNNRGLSITLEPKETDDRYAFDILSSTGVVLEKIVLEKGTGEFKVVDANGIEIGNLFNFSPEGKKKIINIPENLPEFSQTPLNIENSLTVLIAGKNENLVDSIIIAHINHETKSIKMVSLPRDLYYKGRKINSIYSLYGMDEFTRQISQITGIEIDKYVLVDMFAFIDVVDFLGGVDIYLDHTVIDPSYKTEDDGKWGTLYYKIGNHHLTGKQALRLARSRHYSSDFARAERQQLILKGIKKKFANLGFGDSNVLLKIASTVIDKTETNISVQDSLSYYFRYKDFDVKGGSVVSSGNVLRSEYEGILHKRCKSRRTCTVAQRGAYILLPEKNDWDVIKWFVQDVLDI